MNGSMSGRSSKTIVDPTLQVLLFEAEPASANASGGREWLAPRHRSGTLWIDRANIGFTDGHVKNYTFADSARLVW